MKLNYYYKLVFIFLATLTASQNSVAQVAQAFQKFTPGPPSKVEDAWDRNDPNIIYWNNYVKQ